MIVLLFLANLLGLQLAAKVQFALVAILVSALAIYAGFAMPKIELSLLEPWLPEGVIGFVTAIFLLKFATSGAYMIVGLSGEMKNPRRVIPIVMTTATIVVAVLYAFVALASVGVVPWQEMINKPLTVAGEQFLPGWAMTYFLVGGAGLAICTTLNSQFIQLPRTFIVASWDQLIPESFGRLNRFGAPYFHPGDHDGGRRDSPACWVGYWRYRPGCDNFSKSTFDFCLLVSHPYPHAIPRTICQLDV